MKNSVDYALKNFYSAHQTIQQAVKMESVDVAKAVQLYQDAEKKLRIVLCQHTATKDQIDQSNEMIAKCSKRVSELLQFLSENPNLPQVPQQQQPNTPKKMGKISSSSNISTPSPHGNLRPNDKSKSNTQILKPGTPQQQPNLYQSQQPNIYQAQTQAQQQQQQHQNIYQTQAQVQQSPNQQQQNIYQTQAQVQQPTQQQNNQSDQSSSNYQDAYNCLENGLMMDNDGFYDLAKYFYSKSISLFNNFILTATQINQNNINFWIYQLQQRNNALEFYNTTSPDASSYYFNTSFHVFDETKVLQTSEKEDAEVIQRKVDQSISDCISLLKKCIITSQDQFLSGLAKNFLDTTMASNMKNKKDDGFHANYIDKIYPDHINIFASEKVKNEITSISSDPSKKFILVYGPSGTKLTKLVRFSAAQASVKMIFEVNFMKFIGINANPVDILNTAFENAKQQSPSYLLLTHIDACLKEEDKKDNLSIMICDFLISHVSSGNDGVTVFCTSELPWMTPLNVFKKFDAKIYYPAPDESLIKEILKNSQITKRISDDQINSMASELVGYTEFGIERILIEAQISNAVKSSGGLRNNICSDISQGLILRNEISQQDIVQAKNYIPPIVSQSGLIFFDDQFGNAAK